MSLIDLKYVKLSVGSKEYYYEVGVEGELGEQYEAEDFHEMLLNEVLSDIVSEEYAIQPARVLSIIERLTDVMDRRIMKDFYEFAMRTFER